MSKNKNMTNEKKEYLVKTISTSLIKGCNNREVSKETDIDYNTVLYIYANIIRMI